MVTDHPDIVLIGGTGAGKSTAARILEDISYVRMGFAGVADDPHPGSPRDVVTRIWGPEAINDRKKLIAIAQAARSVDPDVWLNALVRDIDAGVRIFPRVVDDCRFENEFWGLKERGFVSVRVTAPLHDRVDRLKANGKWLSDEYLDHDIEHYLDAIDTDYTLTNDGDIDELTEQVARVVYLERRKR